MRRRREPAAQGQIASASLACIECACPDAEQLNKDEYGAERRRSMRDPRRSPPSALDAVAAIRTTPHRHALEHGAPHVAWALIPPPDERSRCAALQRAIVHRAAPRCRCGPA